MRLDEATQVDMVLGDGVRQRGAAAYEISEDTPGVAWAKIDGRRDLEHPRAFHTTDGTLTSCPPTCSAAGLTPLTSAPERRSWHERLG